MKGAVFIDADGREKPYYMGCYGIGIGRTLATIVEKYHDAKGILWPREVAPFAAHLISLPGGEAKARELYQKLTHAGIEVLWDDRDVSAGTKFADCDLIGIPYRIVVSQKTGDKIEFKERKSSETKLAGLDDLLHLI